MSEAVTQEGVTQDCETRAAADRRRLSAIELIEAAVEAAIWDATEETRAYVRQVVAELRQGEP